MKRIKTISGIVLLALVAVAFFFRTIQTAAPVPSWSPEELSLTEPFRVLTTADSTDLAVLRRPECADFNASDLKSDFYGILCAGMMEAVLREDGVGIAGPQVGVSRNIVAVQRFDKSEAPFEIYPNIRITATRGEMFPGGEGCLSVPHRYGTVMRYKDIDITYSVLDSVPHKGFSGLLKKRSPEYDCSLRDTTERIEGFTAVIFQHECDHLSGILYTDRADSLYFRQ